MLNLKPVLYIQISPERLTVTNARTGASISEVPEIAMAPDGERVVAIGAEARTAAAAGSARVLNPFGHPRTLISDFTAADQVVRAFVKRSFAGSVQLMKPRIVIHPLGDPEGGFTQVERRAIRELAAGAGAGQVVVWTGRPLTNAEVLESRFPAGEGVAEET
ncbi:rod shape-determining protein [Ramlibacter sp. USB13]|uniref:Rod shape-determining protein n=1 Tax=Ramlibacter cellulosilyticus TaxID=2764187 RepID=A0A923SEA0_9BURK|nr:rod shape-determining protein [Ramlibacter cellulosilyticus]MBC5786103.1 rod shape-determining protein [Ramlibacter cellulosilyticus]